jgi:hypothetical protein
MMIMHQPVTINIYFNGSIWNVKVDDDRFLCFAFGRRPWDAFMKRPKDNMGRQEPRLSRSGRLVRK